VAKNWDCQWTWNSYTRPLATDVRSCPGDSGAGGTLGRPRSETRESGIRLSWSRESVRPPLPPSFSNRTPMSTLHAPTLRHGVVISGKKTQSTGRKKSVRPIPGLALTDVGVLPLASANNCQPTRPSWFPAQMWLNKQTNCAKNSGGFCRLLSQCVLMRTIHPLHCPDGPSRPPDESFPHLFRVSLAARKPGKTLCSVGRGVRGAGPCGRAKTSRIRLAITSNQKNSCGNKRLGSCDPTFDLCPAADLEGWRTTHVSHSLLLCWETRVHRATGILTSTRKLLWRECGPTSGCFPPGRAHEFVCRKIEWRVLAGIVRFYREVPIQGHNMLLATGQGRQTMFPRPKSRNPPGGGF